MPDNVSAPNLPTSTADITSLLGNDATGGPKRFDAIRVRAFIQRNTFGIIDDDANVTLTTDVDLPNIEFSGVQTVNRDTTLSATNAYPGATFTLSKTGVDIYKRNVKNHDGTLLKQLSTGTGGIFKFDEDGDWRFFSSDVAVGSDTAAIEAIDDAATGPLFKTGVATWQTRTPTVGAGLTGANLDGVAGAPSIAMTLSKAILGKRVLSDTSNEVSPTGWDDAEPAKAAWLQADNLALTRTGLPGGEDGRVALIENAASVTPLLLHHESPSATAANRFDLGGNHLLLMPKDSVRLIYDSTAQRWKVEGGWISIRRRAWRRFEFLPGTSSTPLGLGLTATTQGTITHPDPATGSLRSGQKRINLATGGTINTEASLRGSQLGFYQGDAAGRGGFIYHFVFAISAMPSTKFTFFAGMIGATGNPGNVNSSTFVNQIGIGSNADATTFTGYNNDGSGTTTGATLGAGLIIAANGVYETWGGCMPNGGEYFRSNWRVDDPTFVPATSRITTNIPANTVFFTPSIWLKNTAAADYSIDVMVMEVFAP